MMIESSLRLFKALPLDKKKYSYDVSEMGEIIEKTLKHGYIFSPEIFEHFPKSEMKNLRSLVEKEIILKAKEMNSTFHKSWKKVKTAPYAQLLLEQIFHYITTYGYESLGVYDEDSVYIPNEKLKIPDLDTGNVQLIVIKGYKKAELKKKLIKILQSGIALAEDTMNDLVNIIEFVGGVDIEDVKNKEIKMFLYEYLNQVPNNPIEFLRYVIYKSIGKTLLIKDKTTIEGLKDSSVNLTKIFDLYQEKYGLALLSTIFYRFKPIFLAIKSNDKFAMCPVINKLRRLAHTHHRPMKEDYLNTVTKQIKDHTLDYDDLRKELEKANVFRKIRLAYALKYRTADVDSILYKIRNGKGFVTNFSFDFTPMLGASLDITIDSITKDVSKNVKGKVIYIPKTIEYALPATEKQFTGNFPSGTCIVVPKDLIFGIHWNNVDGHRTDLDLSLINADEKFGWDGFYRNEDGAILFSGDVTNAPGKKGASELFYVKKQEDRDYLVYLNYYNYDENIPIPFKIIVAKKELHSLGKNYMVDPNNVIAVAGSKIDKRSKILGIISTTAKKCRFYFSETYVGNSISSSADDRSEQSKKYLVNFYKNSINLNKILKSAGAIIVHEGEEDVDIDLSTLEKDTILNLLI